MSEINPSSMASQLATAYTQDIQSLINSQSKNVKATSSALGKLQTALQAFDSALNTLSGKKTVLQYSATLSATGFATASAAGGAQPGTYSLFVEQVASANQLAFSAFPAVSMAGAGTLGVQLGAGPGFSVDFTTADANSDGTLSQSEAARAINQAAGNNGQVNALVVTTGGQTQLVLSASATGAASQITLDTSALPAGALRDALNAGNEIAPARDAIVWLGAQGSGLKLQQAGNTFTAIPGVTLTVTQAMAAGNPPMSLTVAGDDAGTAANVRNFADAYNTLNQTLNQLTSAGGADGKEAGAFAGDAGVRALRSRLNSLVHQVVGGLRLMDFGLSIDRYGNMALDQTKLQKAVAAHPGALDSLFGSTGITTSSGVLGSLDRYLNTWLDGATGQIKRRQDSVQNMQKAIDARQARLDQQYSQSYGRYLTQFTKLQQLQSQMAQTTSMFAALSTTTG